MVLQSLIHAYSYSATQNIAIIAEGALTIFNNNNSLPLSSDCCHQNGKTAFNNSVA